jgi:NADPH:quinone reductase-like Zn-dependent oxidoreductase
VRRLVNHTPGRYEAALTAGGRRAGAIQCVMANANPENLHRVGELLADGSLRVPMQHTYNLEQAPDALAALPAVHTQASSLSR